MSSHPPPQLFNPPSRRNSLVNGSAIVAAVAVSFALLVSVIAWIVTHPHKTPSQAAAPAATIAALTPSSEAEAQPPEPVPPIEVTPAVHPADRQDVLLSRLPLIEEAPPPLVPLGPKKAPVQKPIPAAQAPAAPPTGETYGTQVLFLNNPEAAAQLARRDKKLLFVMHISGNFEDSCFT